MSTAPAGSPAPAAASGATSRFRSEELGGVGGERGTRGRAHIHHMPALIDTHADAGAHRSGHRHLVDQPARRKIGRYEIVAAIDDEEPRLGMQIGRASCRDRGYGKEEWG